jgi:hypothetical protein
VRVRNLAESVGEERDAAWHIHVGVDQSLFSLDQFLWVDVLFPFEYWLPATAILLKVFLLVLIDEWHQVERSLPHEDDLAFLCATSCALIVFDNLALTNAHWVITIFAP